MEPRKGDRVRVTYEANFLRREDDLDNGGWVRLEAGRYNPLVPPNATIEVLKPEPVEGQAGLYGGSSVVVYRDGAWQWVQDGLLCHGGVRPLPYKIVEL